MKWLKVVVMILIVSMLCSSCATLGNMVDPYYNDLDCSLGEDNMANPDCRSLEQSYQQLEYNSNNGGEDSAFVKHNKKSSILKPSILAGATVGAGVGYMFPRKSTSSHLVKHDLPNGGAWYETVKSEKKNTIIPMLIGLVIGGGAGALFEYIIDKISSTGGGSTIQKSRLKNIYNKAEQYSQCIYDSAELEQTQGVDIAAKQAEKCSALLAGIPGLNLFKSEEISSFFKIQQNNISDVKKALSKISDKERILPLRTPPKVARILITPYIDGDNILHQGEIVFTTVNEGKWVMPQRSYLKKELSSKHLTPLQ